MYKQIIQNNYKILMLIVAIIMAIPSVIYLIFNKTVLHFSEWFTFFLHTPHNYFDATLGAVIFGILLIALMALYFKILKNANKEFNNIKEVILYILIISIIFALMLPFTSSDIFYYMGTGWLDSNYGENPYYKTVKEVRIENPEDEILQKTGVWENQVVVYGPLWVFICKLLSLISFGKVTLGLYIYKIAAVGIHILNAYIIYKITKKKKFVLLYGLNPFILFEMLTNAHNDLYLVFFMLLAIYFLLRKRNIILTIIAMALATCIKYVSVLFVPFLVLYYLRKEKLWKKILYCFAYAILFIGIMILVYLMYTKDFNILLISIMQQSKYRESILAILLEISNNININLLAYAKTIFTLFIILIFIDGLAYMFFSKKINLRKTILKYNNLITTFIFLIITNLCPWYMMWFIPTIFWLKGSKLKNILYLQFSYELVTCLNFALHSESYTIGLGYLPIMAMIIVLFNAIDNKKIEYKITNN